MRIDNRKMAEGLRESWKNIRQEHPRLRIRDAARELGVSEAELLATGFGSGVTRLEGDWGELLKSLPELGHIMALTRNEHVVHERKGCYRNVSVSGMMGLVLDEEIDLRVFLSHWHLGFAVEEETREGMRRSLQFFDRDGTAVHKVYLQEDGNVEGYRKLVERFSSNDQETIPAVERLTEPDGVLSEGEIDFSALYADWRALQDTHEFFGLLKKFNVTRMQALRNAESDLANRVAPLALRLVLELASQHATPIMIFVASPGVIQIHTGHVSRIVTTEPWINVLDPRFNLHLREDSIASAWIVRKPTRDGIVTSLELFDANDELIAMLFGKRKPGMEESSAWRTIVAQIEGPALQAGPETSLPFTQLQGQ